jgi:hypothetical protein
LGERSFHVGNHVEDLIDEVHIHCLELSLVGPERLVDETCEVGFTNATKRRESLYERGGVLGSLRDEVSVFEGVSESQMSL